MIEHAWSVVCDKTIVDSDSNNISLDAVEQLSVGGLEVPAEKEAVMLPYRLTVASLWYRTDPDVEATGKARILFLAPNSEELGRFEVDLDLAGHERSRTRCVMQAIPIAGPGRYLFVVELKLDSDWMPVARIPYQVIFQTDDSSPAS